MESEDGLVIYLDPFAGEGYDLPADLILVTHEHRDHNRIDLVTQKPSARIYRAADMIPDGKYRSVSEAGIRITAVPAYNKNHDRNSCVGYLVELEGLKLYFAGDTSMTDFMGEMASMGLDYAFLPTDGFYNMNAAEASTCAELNRAKHTVPIHMKPGALFDEETAEQFNASGKIVLHPGEVIRL